MNFHPRPPPGWEWFLYWVMVDGGGPAVALALAGRARAVLVAGSAGGGRRAAVASGGRWWVLNLNLGWALPWTNLNLSPARSL
jgi:hypothetical protein